VKREFPPTLLKFFAMLGKNRQRFEPHDFQNLEIIGGLRDFSNFMRTARALLKSL
jgi:hypothetical protein